MKFICCDQEMFDMGIWPTPVHMGEWGEPKDCSKGEGVVDLIDKGLGTAIANRYHCKVCGNFIGVALVQKDGEVIDLLGRDHKQSLTSFMGTR